MSDLAIACSAGAVILIVIFVIALCAAAVTPSDVEDAWRRGWEDER